LKASGSVIIMGNLSQLRLIAPALLLSWPAHLGKGLRYPLV
jgi:hypothetical protein